MLPLALFNVLRNKRRNILLVLFISICTATLSLFLGYSEYTREGMKLGAIYATGHIVIASPEYWNSALSGDSSISVIESDTVENILDALSSIPSISTQKVLHFSGLIGSEYKSSIFVGAGYEDVQSIQQSLSVEGSMVYNDERGHIIVGSGLAQLLGAKAREVLQLTTTTEYGLALYDQEISGIVTMPDMNLDNMFIMTSLENAWDILGNEGSIHTLQIFIHDRNKEQSIMSDIVRIIGAEFPDLETKTWTALNRNFTSVMTMYNTVLYFLLCIFLVFIFISILQTVITIFLERTKEFGTLRALGIHKWGLGKMVLWEMLIISFLGIILGIISTFLVMFIVKVMALTVTPPGSTTSYPIAFYLHALTIIKMVIIPIILTVIISCIHPIVRIARLEVTKALEG